MNGSIDKPNGKNFLSFRSILSPGMRIFFITFLLIFYISATGQIRPGFTLDDVQLKRFDSKKKYPATVLRYEPDGFADLATSQVYLSKSLYTGIIADVHGTTTTKAETENGKFIRFETSDSDDGYRHVYKSTRSGAAFWTATDSVFYDNELAFSAMYFEDPDGYVKMTTREFNPNNLTIETSYRIGVKIADEFEFDEPLKDGQTKCYRNSNVISYETYVDGLLEGEVAFFGNEHAVLQRYYVSAAIGLFGTYYEFDTITGVVTIGHYNEKGIETGEWISKYSDSSLAAIHWIGDNGNPDSMKAWNNKGTLIAVEYNYWRTSRATGVSDYVHFGREWYGNSRMMSYTNYNPGKNDTISTFYDVSGILLSMDRNLNGRVQSKTWHTNGKPQSERYGVPSGITGVTLRDSVYREWSELGELVKESMYDKGRFIVSKYVFNQESVAHRSPNSAYAIIVGHNNAQRSWDTSDIIPYEVIDSVAVYIECARLESHETKPEAEIAFNAVTGTANQIAVPNPEFKYNILLAQQESVKLDSSGKIITKNVALNLFLDSLHLHGLGVAPLGHYGGKKNKSKSDFSVTTTDVRTYLNLFYVNRRLAQLAPGSSISLYAAPSGSLAPEIIYIPQGEKSSLGVSPVTIVAVAGPGHTKEIKVGARTIQWDNRPFYVFNVYGDGDVEFARTTYKDTILLQYRGERTGVYTKP
jgi:antitoxin component YwqK of YwqJK toxin-antitoxin module